MTTPDDRLSVRLGDETRSLHRSAERTRTMGALLRGTLPRTAYITLLANLHGVYRQLETSLTRASASHPFLAWLADPALVRAPRIDLDLESLQGPDWNAGFRRLPSTTAYVARIENLETSWPLGLVAHAWVRYMGDVSGGQVLARLVGDHYDLPAEGATWTYDFVDLGNLDEFKTEFRRRLDELDAGHAESMIREARAGFEASILMLDEIAESASV